jgi:protein-disulfide isomerase
MNKRDEIREKSMSKREEIREKRRKDALRQRVIIIAIVIVAALIVISALILPGLLPASQNTASVGSILPITPNLRPLADGMSMGDPKAPITVQEFADYQCPGCKVYFDALEKTIIDKYVATNQVHFIFTALSFIDDRGPGRESNAASEAAYCANDQGKFWDYHDMLFTNQSQTGENVGGFSDNRLKAFAKSIELDTAKFNSCFDSGKYRQKVVNDANLGNQKGVNQTPSFLINDKTIVGPQDLQKTLDGLLGATK